MGSCIFFVDLFNPLYARKMKSLVLILSVVAAVSAAPQFAYPVGVVPFHHTYALPQLSYDINTVPQVIAPPRIQYPVLPAAPVVAVAAPVAEEAAVEAVTELAAEDVAAVEEAVEEAPVAEVVAKAADGEVVPLVAAVTRVTYDLNTLPQVVAPPRYVHPRLTYVHSFPLLHPTRVVALAPQV